MVVTLNTIGAWLGLLATLITIVTVAVRAARKVVQVITQLDAIASSHETLATKINELTVVLEKIAASLPQNSLS